MQKLSAGVDSKAAQLSWDFYVAVQLKYLYSSRQLFKSQKEAVIWMEYPSSHVSGAIRDRKTWQGASSQG